MSIQFLLNVLAVALFVIAALGIGAVPNAVAWGLALFAAAHLPLGGGRRLF